MATVLAIDQGTTATKAYTLDMQGNFCLCQSAEHRQIYPKPGWVEHDPEELLHNVLQAVEAAGKIDAIGLDNQGETIIAFDIQTGKPIYNAIVWQDRRTENASRQLKSDGAEEIIFKKTGLPVDPYFSATKIRWIIENVPEAKKLLKTGRLRIGTSDSFFIFRMTGEYATDVTTASRTSLMNIKTCQWDTDLCSLFKIPQDILPEIRPTAGSFGTYRVGNKSIPITACVVDQQAALFGHGCYAAGQVKATFGTGVFALANVGPAVKIDPQKGILPTVAWKLNNDSPVYAIDAGVYNAGSAVNWMRRLGLFSDTGEINQFKNTSAISRGLIFVPALSGLACPYWDRSSAGLWLGMSLETTREDLCQSVLEGIAFRTAQLFRTISRLSGECRRLSVDGGLTNNPYFCQFLTDVIQCEITIPSSPDITALGTGYLSLIGSGMAKSVSELPFGTVSETILRQRNNFSHFQGRFDEAVERSRNWR